MFTNKNRRLMFVMDMGAPGGGSSDEGVSTAPEPHPFSGQPSQDAASNNPAWAAHLDKFPDPVKGIAREAFTEWDKNVQSRFDSLSKQYSPYKSFIDQKVNPDELQKAWGIAQMIQEDPQGFARTLAQYVGLNIQEAQQVLEQQQPMEEVDPQIAALQQSVQQLTDFISQQQQAAQTSQLVQQHEQQIDSEFTALEAKHGKFSPAIRNQILKEAMRISSVTNKLVTMEEAYNSLDNFVQEVRSYARPGDLAPSVLNSGNGIPVTTPNKTPGQLTPKETREAAAQVAARYLAQQGQ